MESPEKTITPNTLNLTRLLRPQKFEDIVGQMLSVSMLKNSLYRGVVFPVYLFSGQHGCGKTTTARVFAAAINCLKLPDFKKNPKANPVPCLECRSCLAMTAQRHPDFIEMDAASHTGVDNIRSILELCTYVPTLGSKKVYLIDEAHMLSKAAFNALLKVLEEPPLTALFILATTEANKVPETVRSRCFQATFKALPESELSEYLASVAQNESIIIDRPALTLICHQSGGSVRDALNLLEQLRALQIPITTEVVEKSCGLLGIGTCITLIGHVIEKKSADVVVTFDQLDAQRISPQQLWNSTIECFRNILRLKIGIKQCVGAFAGHESELTTLAQKCTKERLNLLLSTMWHSEDIFIKTGNKFLFLEHLLIQLCDQSETLVSAPVKTAAPPAVAQGYGEHGKTPANISEHPEQSRRIRANGAESEVPVIQKTETSSPVKTAEPKVTAKTDSSDAKTKLIERVKEAGANMLASLLGSIADIQMTDNVVVISFGQLKAFTKDQLYDQKDTWFPLVKELFPGCREIKFVGSATPIAQKKTLEPTLVREITPRPAPQGHVLPSNASPRPQFGQSRPSFGAQNGGLPPDINDKTRWPKVHLLLKHFPGKIKERS